MSQNIPLSDDDFETAVRYSDKAYRDEATRANDAFVAAMNAAIERKREKVKFETIVDYSPPINHVRIRGDAIFSSCGSPAAMCLDPLSGDVGRKKLTGRER
jgi:hypothetical protein